MDENNIKANWFVRVLIIFFTIALAVMVGFNFALSEPLYQITNGAIIVILIITVLVLAESFNNLSIGKILSLNKEVQQKKEQNKELSQENHQLRENLVQLTSNYNQQSQVNATIQGLTPETWQAMIGVTSASKEESETEENAQLNTKSLSIDSSDKSRTIPYYRISREIEMESLSKYATNHKLQREDIAREVQFTPLFQGLDPIAERNVIFDGYMKSPLGEQFFEVVPKRSLSILGNMRWDKIYIMLSKILNYSKAKKVPAELVLIIADYPEDESDRPQRRDDFPRFLETFHPSINSGLLRIEIVEFSQEEVDSIKQKLENN